MFKFKSLECATNCHIDAKMVSNLAILQEAIDNKQYVTWANGHSFRFLPENIIYTKYGWKVGGIVEGSGYSAYDISDFDNNVCIKLVPKINIQIGTKIKIGQDVYIITVPKFKMLALINIKDGRTFGYVEDLNTDDKEAIQKKVELILTTYQWSVVK